MTEIPVQKKRRVPAWIWVLGVLGVLGIGGLLLGLLLRDPERTAAPSAGASSGCAADRDCAEQQLCVAGACADIKANSPDCAAARVHFDTASAEVRTEDQAVLDRTARCLKANTSTKLTIEGGADERGTEQRNADLAEKRAMSVARYLQGRGVSGEQLKVVSYGDNKPLCLESDKECWAKNRQAALKPQ